MGEGARAGDASGAAPLHAVPKVPDATREAARALYGMEERPTIPALAELSQQWSPWRGVAARILFAYYRVVKGREGVT